MTKPRKRSSRSEPPGADKLTDAIRTEIVTRLAMFERAPEIIADLAERGIEITRAGIAHYKPGNSRHLAPKWQAIFDEARTRFLKGATDEPIANRLYRLNQLGKIHEIEMERKNTVGARATLEQAAKEVGNVFTNVAKVQGTVLPGQLAADITSDEKRNMLGDRLAEAVERLKAQASVQPTIN